MINSIRNYFAWLVIIFIFILNHSDLSNMVLFVFFFIVVVLSLDTIDWKFSLMKFPVLCIILISIIININAKIETSENIRLLTLSSIFLIFPFKFNPFRSIFLILISCTGLYIIVLQIGAAFGISSISEFINIYYPIENNLWSDRALKSFEQINQGGYYRRFGGIYYNPNIMGQFTVLWFILVSNLLDIIYREYKIKKLFTLLLLILTTTSIIFSGSRTALAVFIIFLICRYWLVLKYYFHLILLPLILFLLFYFKSIFQLRIFDFYQGLSSSRGSGNIKYNILNSWIETRFADDTNLINIWFGDLRWDTMFDADPGYLLNYFGFVGTFFILWYFIVMYINYPIKFKANFSIILIGFGATLVFNFRYSILAFFILSLPYNKYSKSIYHENFMGWSTC